MRNIISSCVRRRKPASNLEDPLLVRRFLFNDAKQLIIFDVGAYAGDITRTYRDIFPGATIYCFEPFPDSFKKLSRLANDKFVKCYQIAICEVNEMLSGD